MSNKDVQGELKLLIMVVKEVAHGMEQNVTPEVWVKIYDTLKQFATQQEAWNRRTDSEEEKHPEDTCQMCSRDNPVWYAENELWNKVAPPKGIICPICFKQLAIEKELHVVLKCYDMKADDREGEIEKLSVEIATLRSQLEDAKEKIKAGDRVIDAAGKRHGKRMDYLELKLAEKDKQIEKLEGKLRLWEES